jgi:hypothetical protein
MTTRGRPIDLRSRPWLRLKKSGIQKRYSHQMGSVMPFPMAKAQVCRYPMSRDHGMGVMDSGGSLRM